MTSKNNPIRHVAVLSSGRHDWGYLEPVVLALAARGDILVSVYRIFSDFSDRQMADMPAGVSVERFGIIDAGQEVCPAVIASVTAGASEILTRNAPDILVVLGDRIEILAVCAVAVSAQVVLAHIHGGDKAPGELDDANRHAITKLSHVHFPATESAANRIFRLGEQDWRINMTGSPGIDSILADGLATSSAAREFAGVTDDKPFILLVLHPEGMGESQEKRKAEQICKSIVNTGVQCVCVHPNPDNGSGAITKVLAKFSSVNNWPILETMPRRIYLRLMADSVALVGNSSSGMIESAAVDAVAIDVGSRQVGREHSANLVHVESGEFELESLLQRMLEDVDYVNQLRRAKCIYGDGKASGRIAQVLAELSLDRTTRIKLIEY